MKLKKMYLALCAVFIGAPVITQTCPTCVGRVQEHSNTAFFHEEEAATQENNNTETENVGGAS